MDDEQTRATRVDNSTQVSTMPVQLKH